MLAGRPPAAPDHRPGDGRPERPAVREVGQEVVGGTAQVQPVDAIVAAVDRRPGVLEARFRMAVVVVLHRLQIGVHRIAESQEPEGRHRREHRVLPGFGGDGGDGLLGQGGRLRRVEHLAHRELEPREVVAELGPAHPGRRLHVRGKVLAQAVQGVAARGESLHVAPHEVAKAIVAQVVGEGGVVGLQCLRHPERVHAVVDPDPLDGGEGLRGQHHLPDPAGRDLGLRQAERLLHRSRMDHEAQHPALQPVEGNVEAAHLVATAAAAVPSSGRGAGEASRWASAFLASAWTTSNSGMFSSHS